MDLSLEQKVKLFREQKKIFGEMKVFEHVNSLGDSIKIEHSKTMQPEVFLPLLEYKDFVVLLRNDLLVPHREELSLLLDKNEIDYILGYKDE